jgi:hypothetical protein
MTIFQEGLRIYSCHLKISIFWIATAPSGPRNGAGSVMRAKQSNPVLEGARVYAVMMKFCPFSMREGEQ